jgi:hypothetical protein
MPLQATSGAASYDAFGGGVPVVNYIEDMFSTYLYNGGTTTQTITNGIDLSTKGGMVWLKGRAGTYNHSIWDSSRPGNYLFANSTDAQTNVAYVNFLTTGFTVAAQDGFGYESPYGGPYVSWTFRKQPKFFDIVTYSGNSGVQNIAHNLGSVPGCIIVKSTSTVSQWNVYHRSLGNTQAVKLQSTAAATSSVNFWDNTNPTSTQFTLGSSFNTSGETYIAYLFAHDAGGFGLTGTDNVISCGSVVGAGNPTEITLGYEPQWLLIKNADSVQDWWILDNVRGLFVENAASSKRLDANDADAETGLNVRPTATGFINGVMTVGQTYIYIAIRRGPMKVPTTGTSVFSPNSQTASTGTAITTNFPPDLQLYRSTSQVANEGVVVDRLRGVNTTTTANSTPWLDTTTTAAEATASNVTRNWGNTGFEMPGFVATVPSIFWSFRRAPSFFDEVCYTGTGTSTAFSHNLTVVPELIITKIRNSGTPNWGVWHNALSPSSAMLFLNTTGTQGNGYVDTVTSTTFSFATANGVVNTSTFNYVAYLFATCPGVSKVGSYTGTATTKQIDCGFTAGARFVLIKRTDSTGDWYVWDTARGIAAGNDPYLLLNSTAAEVTNTDYIDTYSAGFEISSTAPAAINASGGTFIFLAIA